MLSTGDKTMMDFVAVNWGAHVHGDVFGSQHDELLVATNSSQATAWIDKAQELARTGCFQVALIIFTLLWIVARAAGQGSSHALNPANSKPTRVPVSYEIASQITRAVALAFIIVGAVQTRYQWSNVAIIGYTFVLGLIRLATDTIWQHLILHQVNLLLVGSFFALLIAEFLPQLKIGSEFSTNKMVEGAIASLGAANLIAFATPRAWIPPPPELVNPRAPKPEPSLEETCSLFSYFFTFGWLTPLIWTGFNRAVEMADLPGLPWYDEPLKLLEEVLYAREKSRQNTLWTVLRYQRREITAMATWVATAFSLELVAPFAMYQLLAYIGDTENAVLHPSLWLFLLFAGSMSKSVAYEQFIFQATRLDVRIKSGLTQELYHRAMSSIELEEDVLNSIASRGGKNQSGSKSTSTGRLANLMASDVDAIYRARSIIMLIVGVPITVILSSIGLYKLIGWTMFVGIGFMIIATYLPTYLAQLMGGYQRRVKVAQDTRISLITEYLGSIRAIKYFAWEEPMIKHVQEARGKEQKDLWGITVLNTAIGGTTELIPLASLAIIFSLYAGVLKQPLTAQVAFPTLSLFTMMREHIGTASWVIKQAVNALISMDRLDRYFENTTPIAKYPVGPLSIKNATFRRNKTATFLLKNITVDFVEGGLNVVTGQSGTGKTTLILAILGEAILESGSVTRPDDVAFASQTAWLQSESIRDNILFHSPYGEDRYRRVINACCLDVDLDELANGDETEVGENGTALSGGQRARVALARALYSNAPLLLLDDTFSALDAKTSASVWERCFCSDLLKGRTTVLITQMPWIAPQADLSVVMENGLIKSIENNIGVVRKPIFVEREETRVASEEAHADSSISNVNGGAKSSTTEPANGAFPAAAKTKADVVSDEMKASGSSNRLTFFKYMLYFGGPAYILFAVFTFVLGNALLFGTSLWLSVWVNAYDAQAPMDVGFYLGTYIAFIMGGILANAVAYLTYMYGSWAAAKRIHERCIRSVMNVSLSWWKQIPVGRVVNRFSRDMTSLDLVLPTVLHNFLELFVGLFFRVGALSSIMPIFMLPALLACLVGVVAGEMYTRTVIVLRRLVSSSQSPVFSQFSDSMSGLAVIRARSNMSQTFRDKLAESFRDYSRASEANYNANRWVALRVDIVTALVSVCAGVIAVSKAGTLAAGLVGFSLSNATGLSNNILMLVRSLNDTEVEMQSFYRLQEYATIEPEEKTDDVHQEDLEAYADQEERTIPENWPGKGSIEFRNVTIRYDPDGPDILKDINLKFEPGERIAVVGRTGAGKSTLVLALLRFTNIVSGKILYDGVDITAIPRKKLRQALTIIPQEAVLFNGTIGSNLDPSGDTAAERLQAVVDSCVDIASFQFHEQGENSEVTNGHSTEDAIPTEQTPLLQRNGAAVPAKPVGGLSLSTPVLAKGENFSHGQRQVLSLCRALVRKSKLMLLDEATASMDYETDRVIQDILRAELNASGNANRTLVTIAHRLRTIVDYDKVVVMGAGRVLEMGSPRELYFAKGTFYDMVRHSGEGRDLEELLGGS